MNSTERPILLLAANGYVVRNLLLGTFADAVARRRALLVAVEDPGDPRLQQISHDKGLRLIAFPTDARPHPYGLRQLTSWHVYMSRFKTIDRTTDAWRTLDRIYEPGASLAGKAFNQIAAAVGHVIKMAGAMPSVEDRYLRSVESWPVTAQWRALLSQHQPAVVVSTLLTLGTTRVPSLDLAPVVAAHALGIPVGTLVQSWDNVTCRPAVLPQWLRRYWTWSEQMAIELLSLNPRLRRDQIVRVGSPQFDFHRRPDLLEPRDRYVRRVGLDPSRPYVLIGTGVAGSAPGELPTVVQLIDAMAQRLPQCQALDRLHPSDDGQRWELERPRLEAKGASVQFSAPRTHLKGGSFVPTRDFYSDQINCLHHAAVALNTASTITVDAAVLDCPVICFGYDTVPDGVFPEGRARTLSGLAHYAPLVATGGVTLAHSLEECLQSIETYLRDPGLNRAGRARIVAYALGECDGGAGERLAAAVLTMAQA